MAGTILVLLMSTLVLWMVWGVAEPLHVKEDEENTNYHFSTKVKQKIDAIKMSLRTSDSDHFSGHHIAKRYAEREADDLILNSFASFCHNFNSDPEMSEYFEEKAQRQPLSTRDMGGYSRYKESPDEEQPRGAWDFQAFPVKVMAQKEDEKTWIVFEVAHTGNARLSWLHFKDFQEVVLKFPESACHTIVSKARFELSYPSCPTSRLEQFRISSETGMNAIDVYVDVCILLGSTNEIVTHKFNLPFFRLKSSTKSDEFMNHVVLQNDNDNGTAVEIDLRFDRRYNNPLLTISLTLWDWNTQALLQSKTKISMAVYSKPEITYERSNETHLFNVEVLGKYCADDSGDADCLMLRITVKSLTGNDVSGQLSFHASQGYDEEMGRDLMYVIDVTVPLVTSGRTVKQRLPQDLIYFGGDSRFRCDDNGNLDHKFGFGDNCVMQCQAYGNDISHIYISKRMPSNMTLGHDSGSYVLPTKAVAMLNIGHAYDEADGEYVCTAVTSHGTVQTTSLVLYTRLFTRVESLTLKSNDTEKALVTCRVSGDSSVKVSFSVRDVETHRKTQLVIGAENVLDVEGPENENKKEVFVYIPWKELRLPRSLLYCEAEGDRGASSRSRDLTTYLQNGVGIFPAVNESSMSVTKLGNGSLLASCTVTGARPLQLRMYIVRWHWGYGESRDYDLVQRNTTPEDGVGEIKMMSLVPPKDGDYSYLYGGRFVCRATINKYHSRYYRRMAEGVLILSKTML